MKEKVVPLILVSNDDLWLPYVLKAISHKFDRYVIYNVGSEDGTKDIIEDFVYNHCSNSDLYVRHLPMVPREVQGAFRNSMIAEARSDWYFILDGDEVYSTHGVDGIQDAYAELQREYELNGYIYGKVRRIEICDDLSHAYGVEMYLPHHRFYHRTAIWDGGHPGEVAHYKQCGETERQMEDNIVCYHFHNCERSTSSKSIALLRDRRKDQDTYKRGDLHTFDVVKALPILNEPINDFPVHPGLKKK